MKFNGAGIRTKTSKAAFHRSTVHVRRRAAGACALGRTKGDVPTRLSGPQQARLCAVPGKARFSGRPFSWRTGPWPVRCWRKRP